jgi:hypothetical protein
VRSDRERVFIAAANDRLQIATVIEVYVRGRPSRAAPPPWYESHHAPLPKGAMLSSSAWVSIPFSTQSRSIASSQR